MKRTRLGAVAILLVGITFFIIGLDRRHTTGSNSWFIISLVFLTIGIRQLRRASRSVIADSSDEVAGRR